MCSFKKSTIRHDSVVRKREMRRKRERKGRKVVSHRAGPCRGDETGGERLKAEGSGTSWPRGDDSISFSSSFLLKPFERTTGDSRRKGKSVSNVICGPSYVSYCSSRL